MQELIKCVLGVLASQHQQASMSLLLQCLDLLPQLVISQCHALHTSTHPYPISISTANHTHLAQYSPAGVLCLTMQAGRQKVGMNAYAGHIKGIKHQASRLLVGLTCRCLLPVRNAQ